MSPVDSPPTDPILRPVVSNDEREQKTTPNLEAIKIPKTRSTGDLFASAQESAQHGKFRGAFDGDVPSGLDISKQSPILHEHEHGPGISGLRRIRQQPPARAPSFPSSPTTPFALVSRASSMTLGGSAHGPAGTTASSLAFNFSEDLTRFPSESLHSFSFAHRSEDTLHNRQAVLKRALEFMQGRLGLSTEQLNVMAAQAKLTGDAEIEGMMELVMRANLLSRESSHAAKRLPRGPMTGPVDLDGNVFESAFFSKVEPSDKSDNEASDETGRARKEGSEPSRPSSGHPEPSLGSEGSAPEPVEPESPAPGASDLQDSRNPAQKGGLRRTYTDLALVNLQNKLMEALAKPYEATESCRDFALHSAATLPLPNSKAPDLGSHMPSFVHGHNNRWVPAAQAVFTTGAKSPWTILAANDLACLIFGVTKAEVKKLSMLEFVRESRREWLQTKLRSSGTETSVKAGHTKPNRPEKTSPKSSNNLAMSGGITAKLLSKPSWRQQKAQTAEGEKSAAGKSDDKPPINSSRGVLLCGDIVPIQKRNGATGAASLWVKEKNGGLIWVLEQIAEDVVSLSLDEDANVTKVSGASSLVWGQSEDFTGRPVADLIPALPLVDGYAVDKTAIERNEDAKFYATRSQVGVSVPVSVSIEPASRTLYVSSFPHIAGIMVLSSTDMKIINANSVFSAALFGRSDLRGERITQLLPQFDDILEYLTEDEKIKLVDGMVVPEHSFRRARAVLAVREGTVDAADIFSNFAGLVAQHRDGSEIHVDVQMRIVRSDTQPKEGVIEEESEADESDDEAEENGTIVYALWITYSRHFHSASRAAGHVTPILSRPGSPLPQPSPGQASGAMSPAQVDQEEIKPTDSPTTLSEKIEEAASQPISNSPPKPADTPSAPAKAIGPPKESSRTNKKIDDFVIIEDMGQGAYGQVKLARSSQGPGKNVVLKYVTKKKILVDTWTRDRRLGTVPLEIHVLDYLRRDGLRHPNIVEMIDFFEDDINYYIEMVPHGLTGMDLFDYIEVRTSMDEAECRNIFLQVVAALHHLHTKALVVHRDIKDENIILDGEAHVKVIDFGSAAYIKNGPFDVFVGTIDYAAPEVLQGKSYRGKEQDIWALGILLYTLIYKENPFYSIDEILDHELRIPWIMSENSIDLVKCMLDRNVDRRLTINQVKDHPWCTEELNEE